MTLQKIVVVATVILCSYAQFDEDLASQKFIHLSIGADSPFLEGCVKRAFSDGVTTLKATTECGPSPFEWKVCFGFVGYSKKERVIFVGYRGTVSAIQLSYEAYRSFFAKQHDAKIGGKLSAYFSTVSNNLRSAGINAEVVRLAKQYPDYEIWLSGHSLGGVLASIATGELIAVDGINASQTKLISFGHPRHGNKEYAEAFNAVVPYSYRVVNKKDFFGQMPPQNYRGYTHIDTEVWYPNGVKVGGRYQVCAETEDPQCQDSVNPHLDVGDHFFYYYEIVSAAATGCQIP